MKILVHTFVSKNTIDYLFYMRDNYNYLSKYNIRYVVYYYDKDIESKLRKFNSIFVDSSVLSDCVNKYLYPGKRHGLMIREAIKNFDINSINIICDSDTVMLYKNWDEYLRVQLNKYDCVGVSYTNPWHYQNIPCFIWIAFKKGFDIKKYHMQDAFPYLLGEGAPANVVPIDKKYNDYYGSLLNNSKIKMLKDLGLSLDDYCDIILADPCWDFPIFIGENKIKYKIIKPLGLTASSKIINKDMRYTHYEYYFDDKLFCGHLEGSRGFAMKKSESSIEFYNSVETFIRTTNNI